MNDRARKEPSMADLEAFERLLRDSLHAEPVGAKSAPHLAMGHPQDQAALAELTRLIEQPLNFDLPQFPEPPKPARNHLVEPETEMPQPVAPPGSPVASWEFPTLEARAPAIPESPAVPPPVYAPQPPVYEAPAYEPPPVPVHSAPTPAYATPAQDPLMAFEDELRHFDKMQMSPPPAPQVSVAPPVPDLRAGYAGDARIEMPPARAYAPEPSPLPASEPPALDPLSAAEDRLAEEAAMAAAVSPPPKRSKGVFIGLGGIALAGVAVIAASSFFSSGTKPKTASGNVPVIAAKTAPTKEKPTDPGGIEIPGQNAQILASRTSTETKPAQAVNTTEQPVDLNQVQRRDSVRVIAPNPYGAAQPSGSSAPAAPASGDQPAASTEPAALEPRRVQSVRIPAPVAPSAQSGTPPRNAAPSGPALAVPGLGIPPVGLPGAQPSPRPGQIAPAGSNAANSASRPGSIPQPTPPRPSAPAATPPAQAERAPSPPPATTPPAAKVETRPATPPRTANTQPAPRPAAPPMRPANAPMSLTPPGNAAPAAAAPRAASSGSGSYAIQLASRPTEADARTASTQLRSRFAGQLSGRNPSVTSGEANGKPVYRVRVGGYSQADAAAACERIKAAGGGCFVTRQ